ncbi:MAG TPA: hypothetical protein VLV78_01460 [Thermoanaerobaculia bacterium]|nr:hypothetical protein [Thermoanaerobaculia bacterium]
MIRTFASIVLVALATACSTSMPLVPATERIALVTNRDQPHSEDGLVLNQVPGLIHATVVVGRLSEIDERSFDAVVVLRCSSLMSIRDHSYDASASGTTITNLMPVGYDVRRGGSIVRSGAITLVVPEEFVRRRTFGRSYLQGANALVRDVAESSTQPAVRTP